MSLKEAFIILLLILSLDIFHASNNDFQKAKRVLSEEILEVDMGVQQRRIAKLKVGTPYQEIQVKLSTSICGIWIFDSRIMGSGYNPEESLTFEDLHVTGKVDYVRGKMIKDKIEFGYESQESIPFLLVEELTESKDTSDYSGLIGFGFQCKSKSIGNINLIKLLTGGLKNSKDLLCFSFNTESEYGILTIGRYTDNLDKKSKKYKETELDILTKSGHWEVPLYAIYLDDGSFLSVKSNLSIGIGGSIFSVDQWFFEFMIRIKFQRFFDKKQCKLQKNAVWEIFCKENFDANKIGVVSIIIGKWNIKLYPSELFRTVKKGSETLKWCTIVYYEKYNKYYLSQTLLHGINTVVYNREDYKLGIYRGPIKGLNLDKK